MNKKTIWITGASSGIGKATAIKFANNGWNVAVSARREKLLNELEEINSNIKAFPLDVTNKLNVENCFAKIADLYKDIDICLFCTGMHDPESEKEFSSSKIREIMETNFFGTVNCIESSSNYLKQRKKGHLAIVSSVAGYRGLPYAAGYCSSKAALINLTESINFDLKKYNVKVSIINPGFIKTPMTDVNKFHMPMIETPEFAANKIFDGLVNKNIFEIHFPKNFTFLMKFLKFIPDWIFFKLINRANNLYKG